MSMARDTGPAQPDKVERPEPGARAANRRGETQAKPDKKQASEEEDMPGADGLSQAKATDDTYD